MLKKKEFLQSAGRWRGKTNAFEVGGGKVAKGGLEPKDARGENCNGSPLGLEKKWRGRESAIMREKVRGRQTA